MNRHLLAGCQHDERRVIAGREQSVGAGMAIASICRRAVGAFFFSGAFNFQNVYSYANRLLKWSQKRAHRRDRPPAQ
ncbi:MAG TPA: hypothetical protein VLI55_03345 [Bryobacteraceae bacterium]|nr:hypothetical protein [Bryobacteraceae bacterium]